MVVDHEALDLAAAEPDPTSLAAGERLRRAVGVERAAWAITQVTLRAKAKTKFSRANEMLFTSHGLEQATREEVAQWRAAKMVAAGVRRVWDLGCGIGSDAMAMRAVGIDVVAVEADPETAEIARHNLSLVGGGEVIVGLAEEVEVPADAAIFLDPARRTARGRTWRVEDFTPSWDFVTAQLSSGRFCCVKLGPGVPKQLIPDGVEACWVSHRADVVEATLFSGGTGRRAVVLPHELTGSGIRPVTGPIGRYLIEPDGAVIRAGLLAEAAPSAWLLDNQVAYLSADEPIESPFVTCYEVLDVLPYDVKALRDWVRTHQIGTVEIKKRAIEVDPAQLRQRLKPKGKNSATLVLARTQEGTKALVVQRLAR